MRALYYIFFVEVQPSFILWLRMRSHEFHFEMGLILKIVKKKRCSLQSFKKNLSTITYCQNSRKFTKILGIIQEEFKKSQENLSAIQKEFKEIKAELYSALSILIEDRPSQWGYNIFFNCSNWMFTVSSTQVINFPISDNLNYIAN